MVKVKIFCMQKDEEDILEEWIIYHAYLFGLDNIYLIDNLSGPKSIKILKKYEALGLHLYTRPDYSKKGNYLYELINQTKNECDLAIPLDIDEFVAVVDIKNMSTQCMTELVTACLSFNYRYYITKYPQVHTECKTPQEALEHFIKKGFFFKWSPCPDEEKKQISENERDLFIQKNLNLILKNYPKETLSCDYTQINQYLEQLPKYGRYSFLFYLTSRNTEIDYDDPMNEIQMFDLIDYELPDGKENSNKKFFDPQKLLSLDHGNHYGRVDNLPKNQYLNTRLVLLHYHHRGVRKLIEKCKNDIRGLGYVKDLNNQRELKEKIKQNVLGAHNIQTYLNYLTNGPTSLCVFDEEGITINNLAQKIKEIKKSGYHH